MSIQDTDKFLVNRSGSSYQVESQSLMSIQDTDLMLVNRGGQSYKVTGAEVKEELGGSNDGSGASYPAYNIDDCFKSFYYTGNGGTQSFDVGFDCRKSAGGCLILFNGHSNNNQVTWFADTEGGTGKLGRWSQNVFSSVNNGVTSFDSNGFSIGSNNNINANGVVYKCIVFKVQPGFFDMQTYGPSSSNTTPTTVNHNLGSQPCMIFLRNQDFSQSNMYYRPGGIEFYSPHGSEANLILDLGFFNSEPSATSFTVATAQSNRQGDIYIAYLFGGAPAGGDEDYPVVYGTYKGAPGVEVVTNGTKPQFAVFKGLEGHAGLSGLYCDKGNIDDPGTYSNCKGWSFNTLESVGGRFTWGADKVKFVNPSTELSEDGYFYFYYFIGR
jgi:hypothetical protein